MTSYMPSLRPKWAHPTLVLSSQSSEIKGQERSAKTSKFWHQTSGPTSGSMASGPPVSGYMASSSKALGTTVLGSSASTEICSCQSEWQTQD